MEIGVEETYVIINESSSGVGNNHKNGKFGSFADSVSSEDDSS